MSGRTKVSVALTDDQLIDLYHNHQPMHILCEEHDLEEYALNAAWTRLKGQGKIKHGRRAVTRSDVSISNYAPVSDMDGRPTVGYIDELLARLYDVHKEPRYDIFAKEDMVMG
jgi:hypothetical protein